MPHRDLHIQRTTTIPQILRHQHSGLLTDQERRTVGIAAHVVRADTQVGAFEALDAVYVEAFVQDAVFDDAVAGAGRHGACAET